MNLSAKTRFRLAAALGGLAVLLGAFGAHGLAPTLASLGTAETWKTAALYHLAHSVALLCLARQPGAGAGFILFSAGILLFSGSLYLYAVTSLKFLVFLTPLGGLCLIAGWISLAFIRTET